jgi:hypothetical protein
MGTDGAAHGPQSGSLPLRPAPRGGGSQSSFRLRNRRGHALRRIAVLSCGACVAYGWSPQWNVAEAGEEFLAPYHRADHISLIAQTGHVGARRRKYAIRPAHSNRPFLTRHPNL